MMEQFEFDSEKHARVALDVYFDSCDFPQPEDLRESILQRVLANTILTSSSISLDTSLGKNRFCAESEEKFDFTLTPFNPFYRKGSFVYVEDTCVGLVKLKEERNYLALSSIVHHGQFAQVEGYFGSVSPNVTMTVPLLRDKDWGFQQLDTFAFRPRDKLFSYYSPDFSEHFQRMLCLEKESVDLEKNQEKSFHHEMYEVVCAVTSGEVPRNIKLHSSNPHTSTYYVPDFLAKSDFEVLYDGNHKKARVYGFFTDTTVDFYLEIPK